MSKKTKEISLADFLQESRLNANLSQRDVADQLGYSTPQFISNWERGVSQPPISSLKKLAELYKISATELFDVVLSTTLVEVQEDMKRKFATSKR